MSGIKRTLDETWYENQGKIELHWMEQEYFNYIARPKKVNYEDKLEDTEEVPYLESQRPYITFSHGHDKEDKGHTRTEGKGT